MASDSVVERATLGRTGLEVSRLGIGTLQPPAGRDGDKAFVALLRYALDRGVTLIDTAATYGDGLSERLVGEAIQGYRHQVVLATKFSYLHARPADVRASLEASLRRLGTDYIDILQQHWPSPDVPLEDTVGELERLKVEGKVRAVGVSNWMEPEWEELADPSRVDVLQPCHSLLWRSIEPRILPLCRRHDIAVIAYSPLCQGLLTGKFRRPAVPGGTLTGSRRENRRFQLGTFDGVGRVLDAVETVARLSGKSTAQTALRWLLDQDGVTSVIVGASSIAQLDENLGALDWRLDPADWQELADVAWPLSEHLESTDTLWGWHPKVAESLV